MNILMTGATGLIGKQLCKYLTNHHQLYVLTRSKEKAFLTLGHHINAFTNLDEVDFNTIDIVINLAGEPIADKRWSTSQKAKIEQSRWHITEQLVEKINAAETPPHTFISGSAIGFYGRQDNEVDEANHTPFDEYSHQLCKKWEAIALNAAEKTRVCIIRTGVVLARNAGALAKMVPPFKLYLGGPVASGNQMMSWIHIKDMVSVILFLIENTQLEGVFNATSPNPVSNEHFSKTLGAVLNKPSALRMPEFMMRLLFGEMADLLVYGQAVKPSALQQAGFKFHYPELQPTLEHLVSEQ